MIPIVDAHHHIWRQKDVPWLMGPMVPRIFGPYEAIRRDYLIDEYLADIAGCGVVKSVYVQANWSKDQAIDEVRFVQSVHDAHGWPHAIVGYADLMSDDAPATLAAMAKIPALRGIRMQLHWHKNPLYRFAAEPDVMAQPQFRKNFAYLAAHGLSFELQVFSSQMADAALLGSRFPETTLVLQHAGMLEDLSDDGRTRWREGMKRMADQPNIVSKTSGLGTFIHRNDAAHIAEVVSETVKMFGADRCLFGSNFPIEKLWTSYGDLAAAHRSALASLAVSSQRSILHDNACKVYKLESSQSG
jgi:predicted TIM-barrel fold metal-dependent hydrolase